MDKEFIKQIVVEEAKKLFAPIQVEVEMEDFVTLVSRSLARIDAERGKEAVAHLYTFDGYSQALMPDEIEPGNFKENPEMYQPLFLSSAIPEGMALVSTNDLSILWR